MLELLFNEVAGLYKKEIPTQVFPCEYCEILRRTFLKIFERLIQKSHLREV